MMSCNKRCFELGKLNNAAATPITNHIEMALDQWKTLIDDTLLHLPLKIHIGCRRMQAQATMSSQ